MPQPFTGDALDVGKATYFHLKANAGAPQRYIVWMLAETTGWSLEYIESLSVARLHEWLAIRDARAKAVK